MKEIMTSIARNNFIGFASSEFLILITLSSPREKITHFNHQLINQLMRNKNVLINGERKNNDERVDS